MIRKLFPTAGRHGSCALQAPSRNRFAAAIVTLALLGVTSPVAARSILPIAGGPGDAGFQDRCPANQFLIGLAGRTGAFVDQLQIVCSPILPDGTHGSNYYGPLHGGTGGAAEELSCSGDGVVSGINFYYYQEHSTVIGIELTCRSMHGNPQTLVEFGNSGVSFEHASTYHEQHCASDELASGLAGRYGKDVNAIGLFCDARDTASAPAPAPNRSSWPIRTTGKAVSTPAPLDAALACPQGFVWREATPADHVCVTPAQRTLTRRENAAGAAYVSQTDRTYGPNTCVQGYVWREAYSGDVVCVKPRQRDAAAEQNTAAPAQIPATSP